ncbi:MAG TPA: DUF4393 domain-containing protein [Hyphomonas sp.]|nr:DUF4393 domain-containing protein [Hyphomonas sp.]
MRDPVERPNSARYARGGPRRSGSGPRPPAKESAAEAPVPALNPEAHKALVADKLAGFAAVTWDWSRIQEYTVSSIQEILAIRTVPPDRMTSPRLDIAIPAIEAMRYSGLKREFALLIASTMDTSLADDAHPSFIEILKQLTLDEVRIVLSFPDVGQVLPFANINYLDRSGRILSSLRYIVPEHVARVCERPKALGGYMDNLLRLNIISAPAHLAISDERFYRDLLAQDFVGVFEAGVAPGLKPSVDRRVLALTDFGQMFRRCCLDEHPGASQSLR